MQEPKHFRPLIEISLGWCLFTFMMAFISFGISKEIESQKFIFVLIGVLALIANLIVVVFALFKWNSYVYIDEEKIVQKQFNTKVSIKYDDIEDVNIIVFRNGYSHPLLEISANGKVIRMELLKGAECFLQKCTNKKITDKIKMLLKKNDIYLDQ